MIRYHEPEKQEKLEEAIRRGFINRQIHPDGVVCYQLTPRGMQQWIMEKMHG